MLQEDLEKQFLPLEATLQLAKVNKVASKRKFTHEHFFCVQKIVAKFGNGHLRDFVVRLMIIPFLYDSSSCQMITFWTLPPFLLVGR